MKKIMTILAFTGIAAFAVNTASAQYTFDPATGTGFSSKNAVQVALGLNNAQLQAAAGTLAFSYAISDDYEGVCTWTTGEGKKGVKVHRVTHKETSSISSSIAYESRNNKRGQITGFFLTGKGVPVVEGEVPVVGGACSGEGAEGTWESVTLVNSTAGPLMVNGVGMIEVVAVVVL